MFTTFFSVSEANMLREEIPGVFFSWIKEDDPHRIVKEIQIERWCYANWNLHKYKSQMIHNFLAQAIASDECWKEVDNLHEIKLDKQMVGKKLIAGSLEFPFEDRYVIACRYCLEDDIIELFEERKKELLSQGCSTLLAYNHLVKSLAGDPITRFWSHFVSGFVSKLNLKGKHLYVYGLGCALCYKQAESVEFFWNKIAELPEEELSAQQKAEILMKSTVDAAGNHCSGYPEVFEFCFGQLSPDQYPELLEQDLASNYFYGTLDNLLDAYRFDYFQELFDCLDPSSVAPQTYHIWLQSVDRCVGHYLEPGIKLFLHMWIKEGWETHRNFSLNKEFYTNSDFQGNILVPMVKKGRMEPVWALMDQASPDQIRVFMDSQPAKKIRDLLEEREDQLSLKKFVLFEKYLAPKGKSTCPK